MFGKSEKEMQETEKLCDLFDRMRLYAKRVNVPVIITTGHHQTSMEDTDIQVVITRPDPKAGEYLEMVRTKERPSKADMVEGEKYHILDFTFPVGFSSLRDGVTQKVTAEELSQVVESAESKAERVIVIGAGGHYPHQHLIRQFLEKSGGTLHTGEDGGFTVDLPNSGLQVTLKPPSRERMSEILGAAMDFESGGSFKADHDGDSGGKRYRALHDHMYYPQTLDLGRRSYFPMADGCLTPERAAAKRRSSDVHVNGRPKKGWQK